MYNIDLLQFSAVKLNGFLRVEKSIDFISYFLEILFVHFGTNSIAII